MSKARGIQSHQPSRFWQQTAQLYGADESLSGNVKTTVRRESARSILSKNTSPDVPFDYSVNPYQGCEHGCSYCYARPTHSYLDMSPGLDFETKLVAKTNAVRLLEEALAKPEYVCKPIAVSGNTDAYQPIEKRFELTRNILRMCLRYRQPVMLITKSTLILRDIEILRQLAAMNLVSVAVSVTTLDNQLKRIMEPRTAGPEARLKIVSTLSESGIPVSVLAAPLVPKINDHELEAIMSRAKDAGAHACNYIVLRLPWELQQMFVDWLKTHFPNRASAVMSLVQQMRGGKINDVRFGTRMCGQGEFADLLKRRHTVASKRLGFAQERPTLRTDLFRVPGSQMDLFG